MLDVHQGRESPRLAGGRRQSDVNRNSTSKFQELSNEMIVESKNDDDVDEDNSDEEQKKE